MTQVTPPTGKIVHGHIEEGHIFDVEELPAPVRKGASVRRFRLFHNGQPAFGGQWHSTLESAKKRIEYILLGDHVSRIRWLQNRIVDLERENSELRAALAERTDEK